MRVLLCGMYADYCRGLTSPYAHLISPEVIPALIKSILDLCTEVCANAVSGELDESVEYGLND